MTLLDCLSDLVVEGVGVLAGGGVGVPVAEGVGGVGDLPADAVVLDAGCGAVPTFGGMIVGGALAEQLAQVGGRGGALGSGADGGGTAQFGVDLVVLFVEGAELPAVGKLVAGHDRIDAGVEVGPLGGELDQLGAEGLFSAGASQAAGQVGGLVVEGVWWWSPSSWSSAGPW